MSESSTIFALSSGSGMAGIAVIRLSGRAAFATCESLTGALPAARKAVRRTFRNPATGDVLDDGLLVTFPGPNSFTGEDVAEFHVHGSRAVLTRLLVVLTALPGVRLAEAGEFTRRAFEAGKLDLAAVEGLADLIDSETEWQRKQALLRRDSKVRRDSKAFLDYARYSFVDTLTLYLHGICCDIDVETGPRQIPSRHLKRRLRLLHSMFPPPSGYAVFPEELEQSG